jgi:hypothetical protein
MIGRGEYAKRELGAGTHFDLPLPLGENIVTK